MQREPRTQTNAIPERLESLLATASQMLGAQIGFHLVGTAPTFSPTPQPACVECGKSNPEMFQACQLRQEGSPTDSGTSLQLQQWICPNHCEVATIPVSVPDGSLGVLTAVRALPPDEVSGPRDGQASLRFLSSLSHLLSDHFALAHELSDVGSELLERREELKLLHAMSGHLTGREDMKQAMQEILDRTRATLQADAALVSIEPRKVFVLSVDPKMKTGLGGSSKAWRQLGSALSKHLESGNRQYFSDSIEKLENESPILGGPAQILGAAVRMHAETEGSLCLVYFGNGKKKRDVEVRLLDFVSGRIVTALSNNDLYENLTDFLMATVKSLVSAIDAKDPYTSGHSERVNILSMLLGKTMGLGTEELEVLRWASILHDVGKIGMPESILNKPGRLTAEEYRIVKEHPDRGYRVLAPIRQLSSASLAVRCHHERIDGGGYPLGLRGDEIPFAARIIAVADTYDALTSNRPYRAQQSPDQAFSVITAVRGTQLDNAVVDTLESLMPFIREHYIMLSATSTEPAYGFFHETNSEAA